MATPKEKGSRHWRRYSRNAQTLIAPLSAADPEASDFTKSNERRAGVRRRTELTQNRGPLRPITALPHLLKDGTLATSYS